MTLRYNSIGYRSLNCCTKNTSGLKRVELAIRTTDEGNFMRRKTHLLGYVLLLIGCFLVSDALLAQDTARVYVIDIRNEIGSGLGTYISDGIQLAEDAGADAIVFDVDTPGGRVDSAVNIIRAIQDTQIPTIAFVNRQAISAGAMISIACNQIVMTSGGTIGDSAPVNIQGQEVGEKAVSYIQGTIRATAERENRNPDIAEAMVDKELVLVKLADGQIIKLLPEEYAEREEMGEEMEILCAQGKLLTLSTRQALEYRFADAQAETLTELLAQYEIVEVAGTKMPLTEEAIMQRQREYGVSQVNRLKTLADARVTEVKATLADKIVFFITNPFISSLLLSLGILGIFIEIRSPGFGVPGFLGLPLCRSLFRWTHADADRCRMGISAFPCRTRINRSGGICHPRLRCRWNLGHHIDVGEYLFCFRRST